MPLIRETRHGKRVTWGISLDPATLADWRARAEAAGLPLATYVRRCVQTHQELGIMAAKVDDIHAAVCPNDAAPDMPEEAQAACQILHGIGWSVAKARKRVRAFIAEEPQALAAQIVTYLTREEAKANGIAK